MDKDKGLKTDFPKFDAFTGGIKPSELILVAGRSGMGVNDLTRCLVLNTSIKHNNKVGVFSLNESRDTYLQRLLSTEAGISFHHLLKNEAPENVNLMNAKEQLTKSPIFISDALTFSVQSIISKAQDSIKWPGVRLFVIHGYNLLTDNTHSVVSRNEELGIIADKLKNFASHNDVAFVIANELPDITYQNDRRGFCPSIQEIYDEIPLAKYADLVTVLFRPEYYGIKTWPHFNESTECEAELKIVKNRHGNLNSFKLFFDGYRSRFHEIDDERFEKPSWKPKKQN